MRLVEGSAGHPAGHGDAAAAGWRSYVPLLVVLLLIAAATAVAAWRELDGRAFHR